MKRSKKEEIGTFTVIDDTLEVKKIVIGQDKISHYKRDNNHKKSLHLNSLDGPEVFKTNDPNIFKLQNGSILKKRSR